MAASPMPARAGRPRDPDLEERVYLAARTIYAQRGWEGFGFGAVAREAGVGKNAVYLRWSKPEDLLLEAIEVRRRPPMIGATLREELVAFATHLLVDYSGPDGLVALRIFIEAQVHPDVFAKFRDRILEPSVRDARDIVARAIERDEIPPNISAGLLLDLIHGAVLSYSVVGSTAAPEQLPVHQAQRQAERIVDAVLSSVVPPSSPHTSRSRA